VRSLKLYLEEAAIPKLQQCISTSWRLEKTPTARLAYVDHSHIASSPTEKLENTNAKIISSFKIYLDEFGQGNHRPRDIPRRVEEFMLIV
jgi:hypothetical protein